MVHSCREAASLIVQLGIDTFAISLFKMHQRGRFVSYLLESVRITHTSESMCSTTFSNNNKCINELLIFYKQCVLLGLKHVADYFR